jgi:hypothetical protein
VTLKSNALKSSRADHTVTGEMRTGSIPLKTALGLIYGESSTLGRSAK